MGDRGAGGRAARPGALAGGGALPDSADHAGASRGVHGAGDAVPHPPRREPPRPRAPHRVLRVRLARRRAGRRGGGPGRAGRVLVDSRVSARDRRGHPPAAPERRGRPHGEIARRTLGVARRARRCCSSPDTGACPPSTSARTRRSSRRARSSPGCSRSPATSRSRSAWFGRRSRFRQCCCCSRRGRRCSSPATAAGLLVGAGVVRTGGEVLAPRAHVLRRAPGHVHSERRLARADARHDDARRAGVSRQGARPAHRLLPSLRPDRRRRLHARSRRAVPRRRCGRSGRRRARRVRRQRRPHGLLRDRRGRHPNRGESSVLHLPGRREGPSGGDGADDGGRRTARAARHAGGLVRSDRHRCVLVGRDPHAPHHPRGRGDVRVAPQSRAA